MQLPRYILNFISTQIRYMSTVKSKNHYASLGLTPKSTQSEIKSAYYKLSMIYHPDKAKDEAALQKFRDITEAYEVLGNVKTRKLYDKGLYFRPNIRTHDETVDKFHKSRETRSKPPPPDGRTPIYDFDEWSKNHYGATFQKKMDTKKRRQEYKEFRQKEISDQKFERIVLLITSVALICHNIAVWYKISSEFKRLQKDTKAKQIITNKDKKK